MFARAKLSQINDHITLINDNDDATFYLVCGKEKAMLIDTANGYEDVIQITRTVTDLPLTIVNTHGHCDHVYGNIYCEKAWLHPSDIEVMKAHFAFPEAVAFMEENKVRPCPLSLLSIGQTFDLGGIELEVIPLFGHTPGSVGLLLRKDRILFTGDGINSHIWMQLDESLPIYALREMLLHTLNMYRKDYDHILTGHGKGLENALRTEALLSGCEELLRGETTLDTPYPWFGGTALSHSYSFKGEPVGQIIYTKEKLNPTITL